jgi:HPt (histidine-containing phosphotransfer) domain-containing protein
MEYKSFNLSTLLKQFQGDEEILNEMITAFIKINNDLLNPIRDSVITQNADQLRFNAHTYKGVLSNFYAEEGRQLACELEKIGKTENFEGAYETLNKFETHLVVFLYEINKLKGKMEKESLS